MAYDLEEQESIDQMKAWWEQWGTPITAAVCVVCLGFAAWNGWNWYKRNMAAEAAGAYVQLQNAVYQNDVKNVESISNGLMDEYGSTVYAPMAALTSAASQAQAGNFAGAEKRLRWVIESDFAEYDTVARVRLAGLLLNDKKFDEAMQILDAAKPADLQVAMVEDRRGDIFFAKQDYARARDAWEKAVKAGTTGTTLSAVVTMKIGALPAAE